MEHLEVRIGVLIISLNLLFGVLISAYSWINVLMNSCVIVTLFSLLLYLRRVNIHNTIKLSYRLLFIFVGILEYVLCIFAPRTLENNWFIIVFLIFTTTKLLAILLAKNLKKK